MLLAHFTCLLFLLFTAELFVITTYASKDEKMLFQHKIMLAEVIEYEMFLFSLEIHVRNNL